MAHTKKQEVPVEIDGAWCLHETDTSLRVEVDDKEYWIPKCVITSDSEVTGLGDRGTLVIAAWLARDRGLA